MKHLLLNIFKIVIIFFSSCLSSFSSDEEITKKRTEYIRINPQFITKNKTNESRKYKITTDNPKSSFHKKSAIATEAKEDIESEIRSKKRSLSASCTESQSKLAKGGGIEEEDVILTRGKGTTKSGGGKGGYFWWISLIDSPEKKAGKVFINWINEEPLGEHASIQIFLNKQSQGKHIGRFAYSKACEESSYEEVYAHVRKSNIASRKSALAAGFEVVDMKGIAQLLLKWTRRAK